MSSSDPYRAYVEGNVFSGNALGMVVALYEAAIQAVRQAKRCLLGGDPWGRAKAISKAVEILTELLISLDHKQGGELSANLKRLYSYMQCRLLDAHAQTAEEPMDEVERLLQTMLEGWRGAAEKYSRTINEAAVELPNNNRQAANDPMTDYYCFSAEAARPAGCVSVVF